MTGRIDSHPRRSSLASHLAPLAAGLIEKSKGTASSLLFFGGEQTSKDYHINEKIRSREVRVIDADGKQLGVLSLQDAIQRAIEQDLDLVEVSPQGIPPVCKIMDFGKFKYAQSKKDREGHKKRKSQQLKEVKLRPKIDPHDFATKSKLVARLIEEGDKVKVTIVFRGREIVYSEHGQQILQKIAQDVPAAVIERPPRLEGKAMIMILVPKGSS